jgi:alpha-ribazole phosphatase
MNNKNMTRLYLARHGQVANHHELRYNGHFDVDITQKGCEQMEKLATFLKELPVGAVYSSDLVRAYRGAEIAAKALGLKNKKLSELREVCLGRWEGLSMNEVKEKFPEEANLRFRDLAHHRVAGGENIVDLSNRVIPATENLLKLHRGESIFVLAHGGVNRTIICNALSLPLEHFFKIEQNYGCLNIIDYYFNNDSESKLDFAVVKMVNGGPNQEMNTAGIN